MSKDLPIRMTWPMLQRRECWVKVDLFPQEAELLALLLLRRGQIVTREEIVEVLWPDADTQALTAPHRVDVLLAGLRQKLGKQHKQREPLILTEATRGWMIA